jgi:hypothetical protein
LEESFFVEPIITSGTNVSKHPTRLIDRSRIIGLDPQFLHNPCNRDEVFSGHCLAFVVRGSWFVALD